MQSQQGTAGIGNLLGRRLPPGNGARSATGAGEARWPGRSGRRRARSAGAFAGGYTLSFWVANATGEGRVWHNSKTIGVPQHHRHQWARPIFQAEPEEWIRYYSVSLAGSAATPVVLTPGEGMVENVALSKDGRTLFYCTNAGDIDRRHVWRVPTGGGEAAGHKERLKPTSRAGVRQRRPC
jgi:hypothetical protein